MDTNNYSGLNSISASEGFYKALFKEFLGDRYLLGQETQNVLACPTDDLAAVDDKHGKDPRGRTVVFGSGFKTPFQRMSADSTLDFVAVRGFLSLNRLPSVVERSATVGDPALLAADLLDDASRGGGGLGVILNATSSEYDVGGINDESSDVITTTLIPLSTVEEIGLKQALESIARLDYIVSDNVVGLAIADSLQIPSAWLDRGGAGSSRFEVMDYFSGVSKNMSPAIREVPKTVSTLAKKTRTADPIEVSARVASLRGQLDEVRGVLNSEPIELLSEPIKVVDEHVLAFPARTGSMILELDVEGSSSFQEKQYLISFDLANIGNGAGKIRERVPGFFFSENPSIGNFRYLDLSFSEGLVTVTVKFPETVICHGFKISRWAKGGPDMTINRLRILR